LNEYLKCASSHHVAIKIILPLNTNHYNKFIMTIFSNKTEKKIIITARPGRKQATATEDFDFHISYL